MRLVNVSVTIRDARFAKRHATVSACFKHLFMFSSSCDRLNHHDKQRGERWKRFDLHELIVPVQSFPIDPYYVVNLSSTYPLA